MKTVTAWLLDFGGARPAAVGERELLHLLPQPQFLPVPLAPQHCSSVMVWQGQLLPVWNLRAWERAQPAAGGEVLAAIVGYQLRPRQTPLFGVLALAQPPQRVQVSDSQACALPDDAPWQAIASACFTHDAQAVPILNLLSMFSAPRRP